LNNGKKSTDLIWVDIKIFNLNNETDLLEGAMVYMFKKNL
jgi:hypothetical protein